METAATHAAEVKSIPVDQLKPNPWNRTVFDPAAMEELAASIRSGGIEEPLIVRPLNISPSPLAGEGRGEGAHPQENHPSSEPSPARGEGHVTNTAKFYQIASGHRRWLAAQKAGLAEVPCLVRDLTDEKVAEMNIEVNVQRENLSPLELARMLKAYLGDFKKSQRDAAETFGKSESWVSQLLSFLTLDPIALENFSALKLGWAPLVALKAIPPDLQRKIAEEVRDGSLSADRIEKRCNQLRFSPVKRATSVPVTEVTPDPLAATWPPLRAQAMASGHPWGVTYGPQPIPELNGVSMPAWRFWVANNGLTPRSDLKRWFLQMAEAMGDTKAEDAELEKHGIKRRPSLADLVKQPGSRTTPVDDQDVVTEEEIQAILAKGRII